MSFALAAVAGSRLYEYSLSGLPSVPTILAMSRPFFTSSELDEAWRLGHAWHLKLSYQ